MREADSFPVERSRSPVRAVRPLDAAVLEAAVERAVAATAVDDGTDAIDACVATLHESAPAVLPSVFVLQHGRLWLVAQRGYGVVPDGIGTESGVIGRALRLGRPQLAADVRTDPDYLGVFPGVTSELAVPLRAGHGGGRRTVGMLNLESELTLPADAGRLVRPLAAALAPLVATLAESRELDLPALARLFVHLSSLRDPERIAELAAASLARILPVEASEVLAWDERGATVQLGHWRAGRGSPRLAPAELERARGEIDQTVVCHLFHADGDPERPVVWLPLRVNGEELGALVGACRRAAYVDPALLDTAAVLAAHTAASLDAALSLRRERRSAVTDALTGILNRRGLEERLEQELAAAQRLRLPVSVMVIDCDDFKEVNDRAGHEFGDEILREVAALLARTVPEDAGVARLGGDEFVVVLPGAGAAASEEVGGRIGRTLAEDLTEAGFPLRVSAGIATYPFDGTSPTALLRAADQALYAAKEGGKDRVASFRDVVRPRAVTGSPAPPAEAPHERPARRGAGSVLVEALDAARAIEEEDTVEDVCRRLGKALVFLVGATAASVSRLVDGHLVDAIEHALREVKLAGDQAYALADYPLTAEVLGRREPRTVSTMDPHADEAEVRLLRELGLNALLMVPVVTERGPWGLVEVYDMRLRRFTDDDVALARFVVSAAERRLAALERAASREPLYEAPPGTAAPGTGSR
ncbi:MAG TPA: diguanylate cyclase [Gaiellaceae bacterium]|nr:diguanylate cyclase [Gaiellaceae bacterium]